MSSSGSSIEERFVSKGEVKEVQGHAINVYGKVAAMTRLLKHSSSTLMVGGRSDSVGPN